MAMLRSAVTLVLLTLVAGCTSAVQQPVVDPPHVGPLTVPTGLRGCQAAIAIVSVPVSALAPHLPEGFRSLSVQELGLAAAPNPQGEGNFGAEMLLCEEADGMSGAIVSSATYGSFFTAVEAPEEHQRDVTFHFVKWDVAVPDEPSREALRARGVPAWGAESTFTRFVVTGPAVSFDGSIAYDSGFGVSFSGTASAPFEPEGSFVEYTPIPAGLAAWTAEYSWGTVAIGPTAVHATGKSLASEVLGTSSRMGVGFAGTVEFHEAMVMVPG